MQERHINRNMYFRELSATSRKYFMPYIMRQHAVEKGMSVLEIGCGDGGNLLPFAEMGCAVTGVDLAETRVNDARAFFAESGAEGVFIAEDALRLKGMERKFDIVICHDVLEHILEKVELLSGLGDFLKPEGVIFMSFPAWQMPFGGHQQICRSRVLSHLPFVHLLPMRLYRSLIRAFGENEGCERELLSIKSARVSVEMFEKLLERTGLTAVDRQLWLINPHYEVKFGLSPRKLSRLVSGIPYLRNFFCTSCFYLLRANKRQMLS